MYSQATHHLPLRIDNTLHPASSRLALARATHSQLHGLGLSWDDGSGHRNCRFAPFGWRGQRPGSGSLLRRPLEERHAVELVRCRPVRHVDHVDGEPAGHAAVG